MRVGVVVEVGEEVIVEVRVGAAVCVCICATTNVDVSWSGDGLQATSTKHASMK